MQLLNRIYNFFRTPYSLNVGIDTGSKNKPTIVMLHGIAATSETWKKMSENLGDDYRIIAVDLLGFGKSPKPINCNYSVEDHMRSVRKTLKKLKLRKPYIIVGHSMGSIISLKYAAKFQNEISRLYLMSIPVYQKDVVEGVNSTDKKIDMYKKIYQLMVENKKFTIMSAKNLRRLFGEGNSFDIKEDNWHSFRESLFQTVIDQDAIGLLSRIKIPVDVIYGSLDAFLIQERVDSLGVFKNVRVTKIPFVTHLMDNRFINIVVSMIKH